MRLTLGLTGMDPATESALQAAFATANTRLGGDHWLLLPENQAEYVVVDMDSMYGPMSWLRLHAAGKQVIALTAAQRSQADFRLGQPFDAHSVAMLLRDIATQVGVPLQETIVASPAAAVSTEPTPVVVTSVPAPSPVVAVAAPMPESTVDVAVSEPEPPVQIAAVAAPTAIEPAPAAVVAPTPVTATPGNTLLDWLTQDRLKGRVRLRGSESVLIDTEQRQYHGPAALKPLATYFESALSTADFVAVDATTWASESTRLGAAMPLSRLAWFGNLLAGRGVLAPGYDPQQRFQMVKWPQTEREYPKHFRIATVMMKGPATLAEIAEASGVSTAEVADFVNANLATGFAEPEREPDPLETQKPGGLFGRLRGR
ncbi:hypothetical protein ACFOLC_03330 [Lysobacter cavernae]|uniref:Uncharacterized protein n=1 Tax=Lysobacter cavernae TaxID=1685901 RepID=A0ABV7RQ17_9GAMM